jgi:hypothetical protein
VGVGVASPAERAEVARALREEAYSLLSETRFFELLTRSFVDANPIVTGSASYDLMVWRDIDIHMSLGADRYRDWMKFGGTLLHFFDAMEMPLHEAGFSNNWVETNPDDAGLGWSLKFSDAYGNPWTLDLWAWDPFDYAVRQARDFSLKTDLNDCERDLILRLKTEARMRDNYYGIRVSGYDIYQFAIAKAGDSLSALEKWKMTQ